MRLTAEQADLAAAVRSLLTDHAGSSGPREAGNFARGYDEKLWNLLAGQIGVAGLAIPESHGGLGATLAETTVAATELGRALATAPLLGSPVLTGTAIQTCGEPDACARLLPGIASGEQIAALAWTGPDGHWDPTAPACTASSATVAGTAAYVLDGDTADVLLVAAHTENGVGLFEIDPDAAGVTRRHTPSVDVTRRLATVHLEDVPARPLGTGDQSAALRAARDAACTVLAAECAGAAGHALEITVEYTKQRSQFGRPIGSFQALKHRMADAYVLTESARAIALEAAAHGGSDTAAAKVYCSEALHQVAAEMIQLHGGIAITWEHDAHRYLKRAHSALHLFGGPAQHLSELATGTETPEYAH